DDMRYTLTLRVPVVQLDAALSQLKRLAQRIDREQQKTDDVTDQYVDLDARLRTLRATETELRGLLAESRQRGRGAREIMEIYTQLTEIRTRIEQLQGQMAVLDKLAALSTINLRLAAPEAARPVASAPWPPPAPPPPRLRPLAVSPPPSPPLVLSLPTATPPAVLVVGLPTYPPRRLWRRRRDSPSIAAPPSTSPPPAA